MVSTPGPALSEQKGALHCQCAGLSEASTDWPTASLAPYHASQRIAPILGQSGAPSAGQMTSRPSNSPARRSQDTRLKAAPKLRIELEPCLSRNTLQYSEIYHPQGAPKTPMEQHIDLHQAAARLDVDAWIELCARASEDPATKLGDIDLFRFPSAQFQATFVGSSGKQAFTEAGKFYKYVLAANQTHRNLPIGRLLDFGCGWGRYTRLLVRDVPQNGLYGVDPHAAAIQLCRTQIPYACFLETGRRPPLPLRDHYFDVVIAYSVFSHFAEINAAIWLCEIARILKPGGILVATTHAPWLLDFVEQMHQGKAPAQTQWHQTLMQAWPDVPAARAKYEAGGFLFTGAGEYRDGYGDALVPEKYVRDVWGRILEFKEYVVDRGRLSQAAFVLRKAGGA